MHGNVLMTNLNWEEMKMKKVLTLFLTVMMIILSSSAFAEVTATENAIEVPVVENGTVVPFTDYNFQITLPSD